MTENALEHNQDSEAFLNSERQRLLDSENTDDDGFNVSLGTGRFTLHDDGTYSYAYGPTGFRGLRHNSYALHCALFASIGGLSFGYDQGVIANVLVMKDFMARWPITPLQKGIMTAVLELGALMGALTAGVLTDKYSRRSSIFVACLIFCIGSAFQCGATNLGYLFVGRAVGGIGVGALSMLSPLYMAEISPPEVRGSLLALEQFSIVLGVVLGFWLGFFTREFEGTASWRIPLGFQIIPGIILLVRCLTLPASPRLLVLKGQYGNARSILAMLRLRKESDPLIQLELLEMRVEATTVQRTLGNETIPNVKNSNIARELGIWSMLFEERYRDRTWIGILMMVFQQWSGINALLYYGPTLVEGIGFTGETTTLLVSGGIGLVQFFSVLPTIAFIDRWGRKPLLRGGSIVMGCCHFLIFLLVFVFHDSWSQNPVFTWLAVGCIYLFTAAYGLSFGPIGWVLPSEVFPLSIRSRGVALSTASNWLNNFLIGLVTPVAFEYSPAGTFLIFAAACFMAYMWANSRIPETANVSLEEVDAMFESSAGRDEMALRRQVEVDLGLRDLLRTLSSASC
ncbi:general substrate transporter [Marasmius fiardii PR-910]|nr:general substrate transporter [Marasmius fiardii PR-910]